jgi:hypothetical protein
MAREKGEMCGARQELAIPKQPQDWMSSQRGVIRLLAEEDAAVVKHHSNLSVANRFS